MAVDFEDLDWVKESPIRYHSVMGVDDNRFWVSEKKNGKWTLWRMRRWANRTWHQQHVSDSRSHEANVKAANVEYKAYAYARWREEWKNDERTRNQG